MNVIDSQTSISLILALALVGAVFHSGRQAQRADSMESILATLIVKVDDLTVKLTGAIVQLNQLTKERK